MNEELKILMIEDMAPDVVLINHELRKAGLRFRAKRVETKEDFLYELENHTPDVILSDHGLPEFDGFSALAIAKSKAPQIPFIFVTGARGEEVAIQTFKSGATDYVLKSRLHNLVPAIQRALREVEERERRMKAEAERERLIQELQKALSQVNTLSGLIPICASCKNIRDDKGYWNQLEKYIQEHSNAQFTHGICPDCSKKLYGEFAINVA